MLVVSPLISLMKDQLPIQEFVAGGLVSVPGKGEGRVVSSTVEMVKIIFADGKERTYLRSCVRLIGNASEEPAAA